MHRKLLAQHRAPAADEQQRLSTSEQSDSTAAPAIKHIVLVEDNPGDARLIQEMLRDAGVSDFQLVHLDCLTLAIEHIRAHPVDILLLDLTLPESAGLQTVYRILEHAADVPVIVLTGGNDGDLAINAVKAGVQDYLIKGDTDSDWLLRCIRYAIERKRAEQSLAHKNQQLEEGNQNLRQLAFAMTHDLQTPLASLVGAVDVLRSNLKTETDESKDTGKWLDRVDKAATRMTDMLDQLLEYAKVGSETIECAPVSLRAVVDEVVAELGDRASRGGPRFNIQFDDAPVTANRQSLHRIIANLLGNAVKFSPEGGSIELTKATHGPNVRLCIADHGKGIAPEKIPQLYLPFKRLDHSLPGTGLGLPISRRLAEASGGSVWLESDGRSGTIAIVEFPIAGGAVTEGEPGPAREAQPTRERNIT